MSPMSFEIKTEGNLRSIRGSNPDGDILILSFTWTDSSSLDWPLDKESAREYLDVAKQIRDDEGVIITEDERKYGVLKFTKTYPNGPVWVNIDPYSHRDHPSLIDWSRIEPGYWRKLIDHLEVFLGLAFSVQIDEFYDRLNQLI